MSREILNRLHVKNDFVVSNQQTGAKQTISDGDGTTNAIPILQVIGDTKARSSALLASFNTTDGTTVAPALNFLKSGNGTVGSNTVVASGEILGEVAAFGADGTDFESPAAMISFEVDTTPGTGDMPGRIVLKTTADGGETLTEALRITSAQDVRVNNGAGLIVGSTSAQVTISDGDGSTDLVPEVQVLGTAKADASVLLASFNTTNDTTVAPSLNFLKSGNGTLGTLTTIVAADEVLGEVNFFGADGVDGESPGAAIRAAVDGTPGTGDMPGRLMLYTTADGAEALSERVRVDKTGNVLVGDTTNANTTTGITVNQGAADDQILALKSSDVAHGATTLAEADTYGSFAKSEATTGGLRIAGYKDGDGSVLGQALLLVGVLDETAADTTKTTAAVGIVQIDAGIEGTNTIADAGANENLVVIRNNATARYIFDVEGSAHADVEWVAFDEHNDVAMLDALEHEFSTRRGDEVKMQFGKFMTEHKDALQKNGIVNFYDKTSKRAMLNTTRLSMLLTGAVRQLSQKLETALDRLSVAEAKLLEAKA